QLIKRIFAPAGQQIVGVNTLCLTGPLYGIAQMQGSQRQLAGVMLLITGLQVINGLADGNVIQYRANLAIDAQAGKHRRIGLLELVQQLKMEIQTGAAETRATPTLPMKSIQAIKQILKRFRR